MSNLLVNISQTQAVTLLAQARVNLTVAVQAVQQAIAGAQSAGASTVTLTSDQLQSLLVQLQAAADAVVQARVRQMQQIMVRIRDDVNIRVRARQMQIANILVRARVSLDATIRAVQQLQTTAQAQGGMVTVSLADAQQILATLQATLTAVAQAEVLQMQNVMIIAGQG